MRFDDVKNGSKSAGISTQNNSYEGGKSLNRRRFSRGTAAGLAAFACVAGFFGGGSQFAQAEEPPTAQTPSLAVDIAVAADGTADWSQAPETSDPKDPTTKGYDAGPNNGVVRVNDLVTYTVNFSVNVHPANDVTLIITFPKGTYMETLPTICNAGSTLGVGPDATAMTLPTTITDDTFGQLQQQTLTCKLGDYGSSSVGVAQSVQFTTKVLNAAANNQPITFDAHSVKISGVDTVTNDVQTAEDSDPTESVNPTTKVVTPTTVLASSRLMWDLSKNSIQLKANDGRYLGANVPCQWDTSATGSNNVSQYCKLIDFPLNLSVPNGGKGAMPAVGNVTVTDDLSLASLFSGVAASKKADLLNPDNLDKYGVRLYLFNAYPTSYPSWTTVTTNVSAAWFYYSPSSVSNGKNSLKMVTLSATNAGTSKPIPLNGATEITVSGGDYSLLKPPTQNGIEQAIPDPSVAYAVGADLVLLVPFDTINDFGICDSSSCTLALNNVYTRLHITGLKDAADGSTPEETIGEQPARGTDAGTWNDSRKVSLVVTPGGNVSKWFAGEPGNPANTPGNTYVPGLGGFMDGPAGGFIKFSGQVRATGGETVTSEISVTAPEVGTVPAQSYLICDSWDNTKIYLQAGNPSGGFKPSNDPNIMWANWPQGTPPSLTVQYSPMPSTSEDNTACGKDQGPWYNTPYDPDDPTVFNNNSVLADEGIYTGVGRMRISFSLTSKPESISSWTIQLGIAMKIADNLTDGTIIPNYISSKVDHNNISREIIDFADDVNIEWNPSTFDKDAPSGFGSGDRLIYTSALTRLTKQVTRLVWDATLNEGNGAYREDGMASSTASLVMAYGNGTPSDEALFTLQPTLTDATGVMSESNKADVVVEDCLTDTMTYVSATQGGNDVSPLVVQPGADMPDGVTPNIACDFQHNSYIRFILSDVKVNSTIDPILMLTTPSATAQPGLASYANNALTSSPADNSPANVRSASATITFDGVAAVQLLKQAVTPTVQVNRAGQENNEPMKWNITFLNRKEDDSDPVSDVDIIDVLPAQGLATTSGQATTSFHGSLTLNDVQVILGDASKVQFLYTAADPASIKMDGADPSNQSGGTTTWCDAAGVIDASRGASTGTCPVVDLTAEPPTYDGVTGIRILRAGDFKQADTITIQVVMTGIGNHRGDKYVNQAVGRVGTGLNLPVGPAEAPVTVAGSSAGDTVWLDVNGNGLQDEGEPGIEGVKVQLTGTDDLNNPVNAEATTGPDGYYQLDDLRTSNAGNALLKDAGTAGYTVTIVKPDDKAIFTGQDVGSNDSIDSDVNADGEMTVPLDYNVDVTTWDAGIYYDATVGDKVWQDVNGNGIQDDGDLGVAGVQVCISGDTGLLDADENPIAVADPDGNSPYCVTTGDDGLYSFTVPPSSVDGYTVTFDASNVQGDLQGIKFTSTGQGENIAEDSDAVVADPDGNPLIGAVTGIVVESGDVNNDIDAGLVGTIVPEKSANPPEGSSVTADETIEYTLTFTNNTAVGVEINYTDDLSALLDDADLTVQPSSDDLTVSMAADGKSFTVTGSVPAGEMVDDEWAPTVFTVTYTITIKTGGDGIVGNWLYVTPGDGKTPPPPDYSTTTGQSDCLQQDTLCTVHFIPSISITKHGDGPTGDAVVGDTVTWNFTVTNTGPVALTSFVLTDNQMAPDANFTWGDCVVRPGAEDEITIGADVITAGEPITDVTLQPKEEIACTGTSQVTQTDIDQATQPNPNVTVTAISVPPTTPSRWSGTWTPDSASVQDQSAAGVNLLQHADISLTKTVDKPEAALDDVVTFTITAKNTGNTTLVNVTFDDPLDGLSELNCTWPDADAPNVLLVGEEVVCTATYTITAADVANGGVKNVATVIGYTPDIPNPDDPDGKPTPGTPVTATADAAVTALTAPTGGYVTGNSTAGWLAVGLLLAVCGLILGGAVVRRRHC